MARLKTWSLTTLLLLVLAMMAAACSTDTSASSDDPASTTEPPAASPRPTTGSDAEPETPLAVEPDAFVPSGPVGSLQAYNDMIDELEVFVPAELRSEVPWPDLRNPDPIVAQSEIFALWIWMLENLPQPRLIDAIAAPDSPDRVAVAGVFGELAVLNQLELREGAPYRTFDQEAITWESAGLPLWLTRDVPEPAVVVYYRDDSGPSTTIDRDTREVLAESPSPGVREWVAILVETDVGWLLWRDTEITPTDSEFEYPESNKPSDRAEQGSVNA